jgi:adenylate cyclase
MARSSVMSLRQGLRRLLKGRGAQVAGLAIFVFLGLALSTRLPAWSLLDYRAFDYLSTLHLPPAAEDAPIIVAIDEPSLAEISLQWPWPRSLHARLITQLRAAGAKSIGLDIIFSEPSAPAEDAALAAAIGPDVVLAGDETLVTSAQADQFVRVLPLPDFEDRGAMPGIASVSLHRDGVLRQMPVYDDGFAATLAATAGEALMLPAEGSLIQVLGGPRSYHTVSYYQALDPEHFLPPGVFKDRIVIVGLSLQNAPSIDHGGADAFPTSFTVHNGRLTAGAEIQATILDNLRRQLAVSQANGSTRQAVLLFSVLLAALLVRRGTGWATLGSIAAAVALLFLSSYVTLALVRLFVSPLSGSLAVVAIGAGQAALDYAQERRSRRQVTRAFSQYLAPALVEQLARDPDKLKLGGEKRVLSILFCDVRGFTTISEQLKDDPEQLTTLINRLLTPLSDIVLAHRGTIDKYIGDCLMAFWNAPLDDPEHAVHAVSAALGMLDAMDALNEDLQSEAAVAGRQHFPLKIGIGINTGECVVGNMGSTRRFDYSALGDAVNLAARLEGASKNYGVSLLLGEETARQVSHIHPVLELDRITVKGRTAVSPVFTVATAADETVLSRHASFLEARYASDVLAQQALARELLEDLPQLDAYYRQYLGAVVL